MSTISKGKTDDEVEYPDRCFLSESRGRWDRGRKRCGEWASEGEGERVTE